MREYKKAEGIFTELEKHVKEQKNLCDRPYMEDGVKIQKQVMLVLEDGLEVELCFWSEGDMYLWDVSVKKEMFDNSGNTDYRQYLGEKGLPLEHIEDSLGNRWRYCGIIDCKDVYRIQYYLEEEDD